MGKVKAQGMRYGKLTAECNNIVASAQREEDRAAVEATVKELPRSLKRKSTALHHGADSKGVVISIDGEMMLTKQYDSAVPNVSKGARATNEYQLLQLLHNASIKVPRPFSYDEQAGTVTMQFITGFPLGDMLDEASPSPGSNRFVSEAQRKQLCQSLFYSVKKMHNLGLYHGDLHANNVLVDGNLWAVYLLDFDNCDPRLAKPTAAGDVSDVLQIGRELLIGTKLPAANSPAYLLVKPMTPSSNSANTRVGLTAALGERLRIAEGTRRRLLNNTSSTWKVKRLRGPQKPNSC